MHAIKATNSLSALYVPVSLLAVSPRPRGSVLRHTTHQHGAQTARDTACMQRSLEGGGGGAKWEEGKRGGKGEGGGAKGEKDREGRWEE